VADSLVAEFERELEAVRASVLGRAPVQAAYILGGDPPWVAGPGTYIHELIELAGGVNVFADLGTLYAAVSPEQVVARNIEVVLLPPGGVLDRRLVRDARVVEAGGDLEIPGPNVGEAARQVVRLLHEAPGG
jgi:iron complex transport system substrate-binding protein